MILVVELHTKRMLCSQKLQRFQLEQSRFCSFHRVIHNLLAAVPKGLPPAVCPRCLERRQLPLSHAPVVAMVQQP